MTHARIFAMAGRGRLAGICLLICSFALALWAPGAVEARPALTATECPTASTDETQVLAQVLAADDRRLRATVAHDAAALEDLLGPHFTYLHSNGHRDDRASYLASIQAGRVPFVAFERVSATVTLIDPSTALVNGRARIAHRPDAAQDVVELTALFLAVWTLRECRWRLEAYASTKARDVEPAAAR